MLFIWLIAPLYYVFSTSYGLDSWSSALASTVIATAFWLASPLIDTLWCRFKFPKSFTGTNTWRGNWLSSKHKRANGKIFVVFPSDYTNAGSFDATALLYSSLFSSSNAGRFREITFSGNIDESELVGTAQMNDTRLPSPVDVTYNALFAPEFNQIAGGYKEPSDVGTFWIRKEPY